MECNKEEALKALQIAEKKLQSNDFMGARKMTQTAQRLYPALENISQLLTVCEVHCSAQNKIFGSENDWYGILQIGQSADETTIKKQYRKLALLLHPDKNKFSGAEAAFKLVGEANRLLSDQSKRKLYDMKYKVVTRNIAPANPRQSHDQPNGFTAVKRDGGTANGYASVPHSQFSGRNSYKPHQQQAFWTCCPFCSMRYQYLQCYVNKMLRCQNCGRSFISYDLNNHTVPPTPPQSHVPQMKVPSEPGSSKFDAQSKHGFDKKSQDRFAGVNQASRENNTSGKKPKAKAGKKQKVQHDNVKHDQGSNVKPESDLDASGNNLSAKAVKKRKAQHGNVKDNQEGGDKPKSDAAISTEQVASKSGNKKGQQKSAVKSGKNCENAQEDEGDILFEKDPILSRDNCHRRSVRRKRHVSYQTFLSDDDDDSGSCSPKKSSNSAPSIDPKEKMKNTTEYVSVPEVTPPLTKGSPNVKHKNEKLKVMKDGSSMSDQNNNESKDEDIDTDENVVEVQVVVCSDPEFSDFDKDKAKNCFAVNQIWAIYDTIDGMPRFYARIRKVHSTPFKLQLTWFEPKPDNRDEIDWHDAKLPIACGKYSRGDPDETADLPMFSHLVRSLKRVSNNVYIMYPKQGETWALFKNWDIRWSSDVEKPCPFEYEYVEILSDFVEDAGISVSYLDKVNGFVSLFQSTKERGLNSFQIPPNELYRFSHQVPSFRMTGEEREGVPKGSFELDPASLPPNINGHNDFNDVKMETNNVASSQNDASCNHESVQDKDKAVGLVNIQPTATQKKSNPKSEASVLRRSPRKTLNLDKNDTQVNIGQRMTVSTVDKDARHSDHSTQMESNAIRANGSMSPPKKHSRNVVERETVVLRRSPRDVCKKSAS